MKITIIGTGYVGLVSGACFSEFGHDVVCVDKDTNKIDALNNGIIPIYEPGLSALVERNSSAGRLSFTTDLKKSVENSTAIFIAVGTPSRRGDGHADLKYVFAAVEELAQYINDYTIIVTKSTVPVGTGHEIKARLSDLLDDDIFDVASNPEFLREGAAIDDFMRPDRVIVGADNDTARDIMKAIYRPLYINETPILFTALETAEVIKYAANAFLATKISFINEIGDLCEKVGADVQEVAKGIGYDNRIGSKFLHAGPGYGGSCFPKDTRALVKSGTDAGVDLSIIRAVLETNENRKKTMSDKVIQACNGDIKGKKIAVLGLTFKPNTDDMRESPSLDIIPNLQMAGAQIYAYDPQGMAEAKGLLESITFCEDPYETMEQADALVIITEWNQFRALDFDRIKSLMSNPTIIDLRNIYGRENMQAHGFKYVGVGRCP
jgi:UDPglucose 6-dehydrogenase